MTLPLSVWLWWEDGRVCVCVGGGGVNILFRCEKDWCTQQTLYEGSRLFFSFDFFFLFRSFRVLRFSRPKYHPTFDWFFSFLFVVVPFLSSTFRSKTFNFTFERLIDYLCQPHCGLVNSLLSSSGHRLKGLNALRCRADTKALNKDWTETKGLSKL